MKKVCRFKNRGENFHFIDWGGSHLPAHFSHATGLCAAVYTPLVEYLLSDLHVLGMDDRGHGQTDAADEPAGLNGWNIFARDLERFLDSRPGPFVAMGHSRGAVASMLLAYKRPDLVKALILIDPTILPYSAMWYVYLAQKTGLIKYIPIAYRAARRKAVWPDRQTIYKAYRKKSMFRTWDPRCLEGYIQDGTEDNGDGQIRLCCSPAWESRCFAVYPYGLWSFIPHLRQPVLVIYGGRSDTFGERAARRFKRKVPSAHLHCFRDNGHFLPMENPQETAREILDFIRSRTML